MELWGKEMDGEVFAEMDEGLSGELIEEMSDEVVSLDNLESDDAADVIAELPDEKKENVLSHIKN